MHGAAHAWLNVSCHKCPQPFTQNARGAVLLQMGANAAQKLSQASLSRHTYGIPAAQESMIHGGQLAHMHAAPLTNSVNGTNPPIQYKRSEVYRPIIWSMDWPAQMTCMPKTPLSRYSDSKTTDNNAAQGCTRGSAHTLLLLLMEAAQKYSQSLHLCCRCCRRNPSYIVNVAAPTFA